MGTESPWRWGRGTISANLDVIWGMSVNLNLEEYKRNGRDRYEKLASTVAELLERAITAEGASLAWQ